MRKLTPSSHRYTQFIPPSVLDALCKKHRVKIEFDGKVMVKLNGVCMTRTEAFEVLTIIS